MNPPKREGWGCGDGTTARLDHASFFLRHCRQPANSGAAGMWALLALLAATLATAAPCNVNGLCEWPAEDCVSCPPDCASAAGLCCGGATGCTGPACAELSPCQQQQQCALFPPLGQSVSERRVLWRARP